LPAIATPASKKPKVPGPLRERRVLTSRRREQGRERDASRYRLADELRAGALFTIPPEQGLLVLPAGAIAKAEPVVAAGNELVDSLGHDRLSAQAQKGGFMAKEFLPDSATDLESPYMQFALSQEVVAPIAAYLGFVPILTQVDLWYSVHGSDAPRLSQLWHLDHADTTQVKVWIHLSDVGRESGPLTALDAATSETLADRIDYDLDKGYRVPDEQVDAVAGDDGMVRFEGPASIVDFVDTSRCFHFGSRVEAGATPRRLFFAQYLTPYAFKFRDHRNEAPFRHLASQAPGELESLLLGAA
jgi:hypothetical protein